jgi:hypothetical protein
MFSAMVAHMHGFGYSRILLSVNDIQMNLVELACEKDWS